MTNCKTKAFPHRVFASAGSLSTGNIKTISFTIPDCVDAEAYCEEVLDDLCFNSGLGDTVIWMTSPERVITPDGSEAVCTLHEHKKEFLKYFNYRLTRRIFK